jgi:hypothetical protein
MGPLLDGVEHIAASAQSLRYSPLAHLISLSRPWALPYLLTVHPCLVALPILFYLYNHVLATQSYYVCQVLTTILGERRRASRGS